MALSGGPQAWPAMSLVTPRFALLCNMCAVGSCFRIDSHSRYDRGCVVVTHPFRRLTGSGLRAYPRASSRACGIPVLAQGAWLAHVAVGLDRGPRPMRRAVVTTNIAIGEHIHIDRQSTKGHDYRLCESWLRLVRDRLAGLATVASPHV